MELAAECLIAFKEGQAEDPDEPFVGALLVAEFFALVRSALTTKPKPVKGKKKR